MPLSLSRADRLRALTERPYDLLIVGGGINGAGIARDAALRGLSVALVEAGDFAEGTSSRSSRLIHGGVRYLEHGHFRLVAEASRERRRLLALAPGLVRPLHFSWPVYQGARLPRWKVALGLSVYDAMAAFRNVARRTLLTTTQLRGAEPALRTEGQTGGVGYYDAATDDARLVLATVRGAQEAGAVVLNHARVTAFTESKGRITGATVTDRLSGGSYTIQAAVVVNATGPWGDTVRRLESPGAPSTVRGSKGVHLLVQRARIGHHGALTLLAPQDGRVMFLLPDGPHSIIGTTETPTSADPAHVRADEADVQYLLEAVNHYFPSAHLTRSDVVSAWAGIRPLAARFAGSAGSASREHAILEGPSGVLSVSGGKLTTYRALAEEVTDRVERRLGRRPRPSPTRTHPLPGRDRTGMARACDEALSATGDVELATHLTRSHGTHWPEAWHSLGGAGQRRIIPTLPYLWGEINHAIEHEMAETVADCLIRRTRIAFETADQGQSVMQETARLLGGHHGWDAAREEAACAAYQQEVARLFTIDPTAGHD